TVLRILIGGFKFCNSAFAVWIFFTTSMPLTTRPNAANPCPRWRGGALLLSGGYSDLLRRAWYSASSAFDSASSRSINRRGLRGGRLAQAYAGINGRGVVLSAEACAVS